MPGADGNAFTLICACAIMGRARDCKACFRQLIAHDRKKGINLIEGDLGQLLEAIRDWSLGPLVGHAAGVHALSNKLLALPKHLKSMLGTVGIPEGDALLADETGGTLMIEAIQKTELVAV